ncbi:MAG: cation-translocating P-type ATPase [Actinomycetota bacterium]
MTVDSPSSAALPAWARSADDVAAAQQVDPDVGLEAAAVTSRRAEYGPNEIPTEPPPSYWQMVRGAVRDPMNLMLIAVAVASFVIGQTSTGILVAVLVVFNVITAANQEAKALATVDALESMQVPTARALRDGRVAEVPAVELVPGDVVMVEAGDLVPADGRIVTSASLEVQEAALTGESAPVAKDAGIADADAPIGDRTSMLYQNTAVSRGTATIVVTGTGSATEMGKIAGMLGSVERSRSPLQQELAQLTTWIGVVAWSAVAIIVVIGLARGLDFDDLMLLAIAVAISAIPSGMPTFVQMMLSSGAQRLADAKAVVKNLTDVETLGATSAINSDKTGTLTLNQMTATRLFAGGRWFTVEGGGYSKQGAILHGAEEEIPDFTPLALGLSLCSDATVDDDGGVIGDPTEAALVVLAAKMGIDAEIVRREHPRVAEVPFDSAYKFMATFHDRPEEGEGTIIELVKGAPDVLLGRATSAFWRGEVVPIEQVRNELAGANQELSEKGLRVLSFAVRQFESGTFDADREPMDYVDELMFVALVGIIDPLRPSAKEAVRIASQAGIDVRMITGDHAVTAKAIGDDLGLGEGVITGPQFQQLTDDELTEQMPDLHVFGRVAPQDKLRLVDRMQDAGLIVAMTGDAVNDAAALKKADIGVAMGSGSEVTKQAARMILTDDHFATLVHAVELGRDIYAKVSTYIRFQVTGMLGVLLLMLTATAFNINDGVALTPGMLLFTTIAVAIFSVLAIMGDVPEPDLMNRPPRDPKERLVTAATGIRWVGIGIATAAVGIVPLVWGPDEPLTDAASVSMTMAFGVAGLSMISLTIAQRRDPTPFWVGPFWPYLRTLILGCLVVWFAIEFSVLQRWLLTTSLTGSQWMAVIGLSLVPAVVAELDKTIRRWS